MNYPKSLSLLGNTRIQVRRDIKRRILFDLLEQERNMLKSKRADLKLSLITRLQIQQNLNLLPTVEHKIKNRCILTGRTRSISRHFKLSRIMIKELSSYGLLPGINKSSW